jgi:hypothetical protein
MKPFQFFFPFLNTSFGLSKPGRETKAVYSAWDGEGTILLWFKLDDERPISKLYSELSDRKFSGALPDWAVTIVPAEDIERVDVYHITANGRVCGPGDANPFVHWSVNGLLDAWLNLSVDDLTPVPYRMDQQVIELELPFTEGHRYARFSMLVKEGPRSHSEEAPRYQFDYTPPNELPSRDFLTFGILKTPPSYGPNMHLPSPLTGLFPFGASGDDLRAHWRMRELAKKSVTDYEEAFYEVQREVAQYVSVGHTTMEASWFWPTL